MFTPQGNADMTLSRPAWPSVTLFMTSGGPAPPGSPAPGALLLDRGVHNHGDPGQSGGELVAQAVPSGE
jgi:hypothetical protein